MSGMQAVAERPVQAVMPRIRLVAHTQKPFDLAVASARTCYAKHFVFQGRLGPAGERARTNLAAALPDHADALAVIGRLDTPHEQRLEFVAMVQADIPADQADTREAVAVFADLARQRADADARIADSIFEAGHHTPFQHPTFVFALEDVSRNVVESFFHNHTFYNSEQQSQRYVEMASARVHVPDSVAADAAASTAYEGAISAAWDAYHDLRQRLVASNIKVMTAIGRIKGQDEEAIRKEAEKKAQEMARYVIPVAAATQLYHTVSGIVLLRYARMCRANNVPAEAENVVQAMLDAVAQVDPEWIERIRQEPHDAANLPETLLAGATSGAPEAAAKDLLPPGEVSVLVRHTADAAALVEEAVREVTGSQRRGTDLLDAVLDPAAHAVWNDTLNTWDHSPVLRSLRHVHLTYRKRLSLTAHAQDQRHRLTPGTRPLLTTLLTANPDVYVPDIIADDEAARAVFDGAIQRLWSTMLELRDQHDIPAADCTYLLPNAAAFTFTQSGDLLSWIHKWRLRLCFNAQKEIFESSLEELRQAQSVMPELTRYIGPPCSFIAARVPADQQDSVDACCPEGPRWCGVKVWKNFDAGTGKPKRPY